MVRLPRSRRRSAPGWLSHSFIGGFEEQRELGRAEPRDASANGA